MSGHRILLITTGGTIAQTHDEAGVTTQNKDSQPFAEMVDSIKDNLNEKAARGLDPEIHEIECVSIRQVLNKDSSNVVSDDWKNIINTIVEEYDNYEGFVITHGTNTLGYTSAALSFALEAVGKPVILTGSQVSFGYPGSDAPMNLENSIRVAAYKKNKHKRLCGVMVVFGSMIITGVRVKKTNEFNYDSFEAFNSPHTIARIGNTIRFNNIALDAHFEKFENGRLSRQRDLKPHVKLEFKTECIASLTEFPGTSPDIFEALVKHANVKGFILRSFGAGDPNVLDLEKIKDGTYHANLNKAFQYLMDKEIPIIITTQAPTGKASMDINDPGRYAVEKFNAIPAHDMSIESMTVKLAWLLGQGCSYDEIRKQMSISLRGEIAIPEKSI
ncbi:MAG: asparaginase [Bacteroidales bacterium]|jgi:L-asparaginase|nr:asparaginase [Bacteroidales bacterium]